MKWKQIKHAGYIWRQTIALSIVACELENYCNLLVIASNGTTIDVRQNLYCVMLTDEEILENKLQGWLETYC